MTDDLVERAEEQLPGIGLDTIQRVMGPVWGPLAKIFFPDPPDPLRELQTRIAAATLTKALAGSAVPVMPVKFPDLIRAVGDKDGRQDWVLVGSRGFGKTACAFAIAEELRNTFGYRVAAVGIPGPAAEALGVARWDVARDLAKESEGTCVIFDEAGLRIASSRRQAKLVELLAVARHRGTCVIWTSQHLSGLSRDVLRQDAAFGFKKVDPMAAAFDREESVQILAEVVTLQGRFPGLMHPAGLLVRRDGQWIISKNELPSGWTEDVSRMWR